MMAPIVANAREMVEQETVKGMEGPEGGIPLWASRFAQRRQRAHTAASTPSAGGDTWISGAISSLWSLVDAAVAQANEALAEADLDERIAVRKTSDERHLALPGPDGTQRHIALSVGVRAVGDRASGGAQITTSETRASIYAIPAPGGSRVRWTIPASGQELTARIVDDLLLSVFGDDPGATTRLAAHFSTGEGS